MKSSACPQISRLTFNWVRVKHLPRYGLDGGPIPPADPDVLHRPDVKASKLRDEVRKKCEQSTAVEPQHIPFKHLTILAIQHMR